MPSRDESSSPVPTHTVYFGLGSNLGDRDRNLQDALYALARIVHLTDVSAVYDTAPVLVTDQPRFRNAVCAGQTTLSPVELLRHSKASEASLGRVPGPRYGPRLVDIDLLFYDDLVLESPELVLPHPRLAERAFVLAPLAEIAPNLMHPVLHATVASLAARAPIGTDVRGVGHLLTLPA